ncbi:MAG TPA: hypothetical protein VFB76_06100 [Candidatus Angelobacter sp.]|nr:hypothetical protein [Candidatus Angelobacter sp.]
MSLLSLVAGIDESDFFHLSRLLILVSAFAGPKRIDSVEGITKLAKLDFLLRYPEYLERALRARHANSSLADVKEFERNSVESAMVRYKYGPWDFRYRRFLNLLVGKGLAHISLDGRTVHIGITERGRELATKLAETDEFTDIAERSRLLKSHFDLSATNLVKFIYQTFPEIGNLRYGTKISQ